MTQSPPQQAPDAAPDDREVYQRFREIALSMAMAEELSPNTSAKLRTKVDYITLIAHLRRSQTIVHAPAALLGIIAFKNGDIRMARMLFEELRERVIRPSPLFYLVGATWFVLALVLIIGVAMLFLVTPDGRIMLGPMPRE